MKGPDLRHDVRELASGGDAGFRENVFAVPEPHNGGQCANAHDRSEILLFVSVHCCEQDIIELCCYVSEDGTESRASRAPWGPEIYDNGVVMFNCATQGGQRQLTHRCLPPSLMAMGRPLPYSLVNEDIFFQLCRIDPR